MPNFPVAPNMASIPPVQQVPSAPAMGQYGPNGPVNPFANNPGPMPPQLAGRAQPQAPHMFVPGAAGGGPGATIIQAPTQASIAAQLPHPANMDQTALAKMKAAQFPSIQTQPIQNPNVSGGPARPLPAASDSVSVLPHFGAANPAAAIPRTPLNTQFPIMSDIRVKEQVQPAGKDPFAALDAAYAREGADTHARFADAPNHDESMRQYGPPVADMRAAKLYDYNYKNPAYGHGPQRGTMAQELEKTAASPAVSVGPDGLKRVDTGKLSMVLAPAVGELQDKVMRMEAEKAQADDEKMRMLKEKDKQFPEAQISQPPPEWKYIPSKSDQYVSDEQAKKDINPADEMKQFDEDTQSEQDAKDEAEAKADRKKRAKAFSGIGSAITAPYNQPLQPLRIPGVQSPYVSSDEANKTNIVPADYRAVPRKGTPRVPPPQAIREPEQLPIAPQVMPPGSPPVGERERAIAAGYAWLAAHGDPGALKHEQYEPMPAEREQNLARSMGEQIPMRSTGMDAMQSAGLPTQREADMAAIIADWEARHPKAQ